MKFQLIKYLTLNLLMLHYSYTGEFQWQKGSDLNENFVVTDNNGM